jgi:hypothetical protein
MIVQDDSDILTGANDGLLMLREEFSTNALRLVKGFKEIDKWQPSQNGQQGSLELCVFVLQHWKCGASS